MARLLRSAIVMACILFAGTAFAAGGACPSGANYTNPTNPNGAPVTLASLGITNCYYIAASGSDSNSGTSESSPWLHSPGMANCSNTCAGVNLQNSTGAIGIIFRGGDTWHEGNASAAPYTGIVTACSNNGTLPAALCWAGIKSTSSGSPIYFGVDQTWFTGGAWVRPVFTADNPLCNANTANGTTCVSNPSSDCRGGMGSACTGLFYVSSCPYQVTSTTNNLVEMSSSKYLILDNLELTGLCQSILGHSGGQNMYLDYGGAQGPLTFMNLYAHGSSHLKFTAPNGDPACTSSVVCFNASAFNGGVIIGTVGETVVLNAIDFSDSDPIGEGLCNGGFYNAAYNAFRYTSQCLPGVHTFHDNLYEWFFENGHSNMIESADTWSSTNTIHNNVFRHIATTVATGGSVGLWLGPVASTTTDYIFNNLMYDVGNLEYLNNGGVGLTTNHGSYIWLNNTFQSNVNQPIMRVNASTGNVVLDINNHYIDNGGQYLTPSGQSSSIRGCTTCTSITPLAMTNAVATTDGYTSSQTFAYSPTSGSSPTAGTGTNKQSICSTLSAAAGSDPILSDAAAACANDTLYACSYDTSTHSVSCPARTIAPRPTSTAWNIGAYESNGAQAPGAPANLAATVQ